MNEVVMSKQWAKDLRELEDRRDAFWEFVEIVKRIRDSKSYLEEYATFEDFMEDRCGWERRHGYHLLTACEVRQSLGAIVPKDNLPCAESHLRELAKVPPAKRAAVFAEVSEKCEEEKREPTAKDYRKAAAEYVQPEPEPEKPAPKSEPVDWQKLRTVALRHGEAMVRAIDDLCAVRKFPKRDEAVRSVQGATEILRGVK